MFQEDLLIHGDSVYDMIDKQDHQAVSSELVKNTPSPGEDERLFLCRMNVSRNARRQMRFGDQKVSLLCYSSAMAPQNDQSHLPSRCISWSTCSVQSSHALQTGSRVRLLGDRWSLPDLYVPTENATVHIPIVTNYISRYLSSINSCWAYCFAAAFAWSVAFHLWKKKVYLFDGYEIVLYSITFIYYSSSIYGFNNS